MGDLDRRSALVLGFAATSAFALGGSGLAEAAVGDETDLAPGVKQKILGEGPAMIPGYKTVQLRDISWQPGASAPVTSMKNHPMVCHITEGELQITQDGKPFAAKKNYVWTCNTGPTKAR